MKCAFTLITRQANQTAWRHYVRSVMACLAVPYFSSPSHKRHDFSRHVPVINVCFISSTTVIWNLLQPRNLQWLISRHVLMWPCRV